MSFAFVASSSIAGTGVTEVDLPKPTPSVAGQLLVAVFAFENVAAGSGPWIIPNISQFSSSYIGPGRGWQQACWQGPSAAGVGIEVWWAINGGGASAFAMLTTSQNAVGVCAAYTGEYNPTGTVNPSTIRLAPTAQVTGNQPAAPSVAANANELVVACGGDLMGASGFGAPSGFTNRVDAARSGAGTVEATIADATMASAVTTGPITFPNAANAATTKGATATLVAVPVPTVSTSLPVIDVGMPEGVVLGPGWTLRVTALDAATGSTVSGVTAANVIFTDAMGVEVTPPDPVPPLLVNEEPPS